MLRAIRVEGRVCRPRVMREGTGVNYSLGVVTPACIPAWYCLHSAHKHTSHSPEPQLTDIVLFFTSPRQRELGGLDRFIDTRCGINKTG